MFTTDANAEIFTTADSLAQHVFDQDTQQITVFIERGTRWLDVFALACSHRHRKAGTNGAAVDIIS